MVRSSGRRPLAAALLVAALGGACAAMRGGTVLGTIDAVDPEARTILIGGRTVHVSDFFNLDGIMAGSKYRVLYQREGDRYVAIAIEPWRAGGEGGDD